MWSVGEVVCLPDMDNADLNYFLELEIIKKGLKSLHPSVECWRGCECPGHGQWRPKLFPGYVKNKKGLKSLHPSVECWSNAGLNYFL